MSKDAEVDMRDVELSELELETQPMTRDGAGGAGEKNGNPKLPAEEEVKFTGLSKDELMKVAGTPGWVRTRCVLLALFWLGWLGMLAGAIAIIVQAPRCKPIPEMNWWNEGPLYQISSLKDFTPDGTIKGVDEKLDTVNQLKVKGLLLGPFHQVQANQFATMDLRKIDPSAGTEADLSALLGKADKKGISVVLDLTPNYMGNKPWFGNTKAAEVTEKVREASKYWMDLGVAGVELPDPTMPNWSLIREAVANETDDGPRKKALIAVVTGMSADQVSELLNSSSVDLLISDLLSMHAGGAERAQAIATLAGAQSSVGWTLGAAAGVHLASEANTPDLVKLYQLLLFTLPGTPVFSYGDEIGLEPHGTEPPMMLWDIDTEPEEGAAVNKTVEEDRKLRVEIRKWFKSLSDLRGKERSLLHGEYTTLNSSATALAFLRLWDQSDRYVTAVNWGPAPVTLALRTGLPDTLELPAEAEVMYSTDPALEESAAVGLEEITLGPGKAVLLKFPFTP